MRLGSNGRAGRDFDDDIEDVAGRRWMIELWRYREWGKGGGDVCHD